MGNELVQIVQLGADEAQLWNDIRENSDDCNYNYILSWIELSALVNKVKYSAADTRREVIYYDGKAVGIWIYTIVGQEEKKLLTNDDPYIVAPIFIRSCEERIVRTCIDKCMEELQAVCKENNIPSFTTGIVIKDAAVTQWQLALLDGRSVDGANSYLSSRINEVGHLYYIDLRPDDIMAQFSSSSRRKIRRGLEGWKIKIYDQITWEEMDAYRQFHEMIKGGATRGVETWKVQMDSINCGEALLVTLSDDAGFVGGCIFYLSTLEGYANSAAYVKNDSAHNIGHTIQYLGSKYMQEKGIPWHRIGYCCHSNDIPTPSPKEQAISDFKRTIASDVFMNVYITCQAV